GKTRPAPGLRAAGCARGGWGFAAGLGKKGEGRREKREVAKLQLFSHVSLSPLSRTGARMFTGIIKALGTVESLESRGGDVRLRVALGALAGHGFATGESIAVNGVCLTAVEPADTHLVADVSR